LTVSWPALVAWLGSVALAVVAWQSGWIHLFFLALPVWLTTAVVYTALSAAAGARGPMPGETGATAPPAAPVAAAAVTDPPGPRTAAWTASGAVTLATLVALLVLPFWVFASGAGEWEARLASFKTIALALTVVYFVAGVAWMNENEKRRARGGR
jgi:NCS1 family nucleobase:cation symporter-1